MQKPRSNHLVFILVSMIVTMLVVRFMLTENFDTRSQASEDDGTWVAYRSSGFESGNFTDWDQINAADGTMTVVSSNETPPTPFDGNTKVAKAYQNGSNTTDGHFSRTIWNLSGWTDQTYAAQAYFYLPPGFYASMQGSVQLMGWDTNPVPGNQMRLIIYNSDKKARLFINENNVGREITDTFFIPEGQWVKLRIEQRINQEQGWSRVYMNDALAAQGNAADCSGNATRCQDTFANEPVTRMRYGLVAIADQVQLKPLTVYFDEAKLQLGQNVDTSPELSPSPAQSSIPL